MAYKALYRTYRPDDFNQMVGQKHIVKTLQNAIERNQIAHAYLFCGPRGTGKTSTAKIFAKAINCEASEHKPCGVCDNCKEAQSGAHSDIIEIDAASNNGVEEARNLIEKVKYAPLLGKYKVYIIDEVHMMSTSAFNALLKTIEEPPAHVIFILATTEPHKVIPTIVSRCQRFDFAKVSKSEIVERLSFIVKEEGIQTDQRALESIALLSDGGMRDALSILDQCRAYSPDKLTVEDVNEIYGVVSTQELCHLFESAKYKRSDELIRKIEEYDRNGVDIKRLTTDLINILKESIIYDYSSDESMLHVMNAEQVKKCRENTSTKDRLKMIDILMDTYERYYQASTISSYFEIGMLKIMNEMEDGMVESLPHLDNYTQSSKVSENIQEQVTDTGKEMPLEETITLSEEIEDSIVISSIDEMEEIPFEVDKQTESMISNVEENESIESASSSDGIDEEVMIDNKIVSGPQDESKVVNNDQQNEESIVASQQESLQVEEVVAITEEIDEDIGEKEEPVPHEKVKSLSDDFLLSLLVAANKLEKNKDRSQMLNILSYTLDVQYAKYANLLKSCSIVASGENFIVVSVDSQVLANEINEMDKNSEFLAFGEVLLAKAKKVFAITNEKTEELIELFKQRSIEQTLPQPANINIELQEENSEDEQISTIKSLFDDITIMEE